MADWLQNNVMTTSWVTKILYWLQADGWLQKYWWLTQSWLQVDVSGWLQRLTTSWWLTTKKVEWLQDNDDWPKTWLQVDTRLMADYKNKVNDYKLISGWLQKYCIDYKLMASYKKIMYWLQVDGWPKTDYKMMTADYKNIVLTTSWWLTTKIMVTGPKLTTSLIADWLQNDDWL